MTLMHVAVLQLRVGAYMTDAVAAPSAAAHVSTRQIDCVLLDIWQHDELLVPNALEPYAFKTIDGHR
jgi:hypothetical protein